MYLGLDILLRRPLPDAPLTRLRHSTTLSLKVFLPSCQSLLFSPIWFSVDVLEVSVRPSTRGLLLSHRRLLAKWSFYNPWGFFLAFFGFVSPFHGFFRFSWFPFVSSSLLVLILLSFGPIFSRSQVSVFFSCSRSRSSAFLLSLEQTPPLP